MTDKLTVPFNESGYSVSEIAADIRNETKGGLSRSRADLDNIALSVSLNWTLQGSAYNDFVAFYEEHLGVSFLYDLVIDNGDLQEYEVNFASDLSLVSVINDHYTVSATLEVLPNETVLGSDEAICVVYAASNKQPLQYINAFEKIILAWPEA